MKNERLIILSVSEFPDATEQVIAWILEEWGNTHNESDAEIRNHILGKEGNPEAMVAVFGQVPVGAVSFKMHDLLDEKKDVLWINALYVAELHRGKGIGARLIAEAEEVASHTEVNIYAFTDIPDFYEACGWKRHSEHAEFKNWIVFKSLESDELSKAFDAKLLLRRAETPEELDEVRKLFREYEEKLAVDLCFQDFENELKELPGRYAHPDGDLLVGLMDGKVMGCVAVRKLVGECCEMKRLYVRPESRGKGMGKQLAKTIISRSRELGYTRVRLDTLGRLTEAMSLYEQLGFKKIDAYYDNPLADVVYWELDLSSLAD